MNNKQLTGSKIKMSVCYQGRKIDILKGVDFTAEPGKITAIVGNRESGKTSLLNIITGKIDNTHKTTGNITYGNHLRENSFPSEYSTLCNDDVINEKQGIFAYLMFIARIMNRNETAREIEKRVRSVLKDLSISDYDHGIIENLSAGNKKKIYLANALISNKKIVILDQPLSTLDNNSAIEVIKFLKDWTIRNHIIMIITMQQPNSVICSYFDNFVYLHNGCSVYSGLYSEFEGNMVEFGFINKTNWDYMEYFYSLLSTNTSLSSKEEKLCFQKICMAADKTPIDVMKSADSYNWINEQRGFSYWRARSVSKKQYSEIYANISTAARFFWLFVVFVIPGILFYIGPSCFFLEFQYLSSELLENIAVMKMYMIYLGFVCNLFLSGYVFRGLRRYRKYWAYELNRGTYTFSELVVSVILLYISISVFLYIPIILVAEKNILRLGDPLAIIWIIFWQTSFSVATFLSYSFICIFTRSYMLVDILFTYFIVRTQVQINDIENITHQVLAIALSILVATMPYMPCFVLLDILYLRNQPKNVTYDISEFISTKYRKQSKMSSELSIALSPDFLQSISKIGFTSETYLAVYSFFFVCLAIVVYQYWKKCYSIPMRLKLEI